jgi:hypothetical protein
MTVGVVAELSVSFHAWRSPSAAGSGRSSSAAIRRQVSTKTSKLAGPGRTGRLWLTMSAIVLRLSRMRSSSRRLGVRELSIRSACRTWQVHPIVDPAHIAAPSAPQVLAVIR